MRPFVSRTRAADSFLKAVLADPEQVLIALDFDGTLAPIVPDPEDSRLLPEAAEALAELGPRIGHLAILTGRGVDTVRRLGRLDQRPGLERVVVLGQYGAERWDAATGEQTPAEEPEEVLAASRDVAALLANGGAFEGVRLEDKGRALGVHTRRAVDPEGAYQALEQPLAEIAAMHGLTLEPGRSVLELRASTITKGDALAQLVEETGATVVAVCGDDLGDLPAFDYLDVLARQGVRTCAVVSASPEQASLDERADVLASGPAGVAAWLQELANRLNA